MNKTEVKLLSPSLAHLLSYAELKMPLYQRRYSWGEKGEADAGLDYFNQFLVNKEATSFFGQIYLFSDKRWDYLDDESARVWLSDGQHRLVTVVLSALAMTPLLQQVRDSNENDEEVRALACELLETDEIHAIANSNLQVVVTPGSPPMSAVEFIATSRRALQDLEDAAQKLSARLGQRNQEIKALTDKAEKDSARRALKEEFKLTQDSISKKVLEIRTNGIFQTYTKISDQLALKNPWPLTQLAQIFVARISKLRASVVCLQPEEGSRVSPSLLEEEAFAMFAQMNGHATPLDEGELLRSYVESKRDNHPALNLYFETGSVKHGELQFFDIADDQKLCDYFTKFHTGNGNLKGYTWVKSELYSSKAGSDTLAGMTSALDCLTEVHARILDLPEAWQALYRIMLKEFSRIPYLVYLTRCCETKGYQERPEAYLKEALKMLVLFEISNIFQPKMARFNIGRDIPAKEMNGLRRGISHVRKHFDTDSNADLRRKMGDYLSTAKMGTSKYRKLAKLLLILADFEKAGRDVTVGSWSAYEYEHVLPSVHSGLTDEPDLPAQVEASLREFLALPLPDRLLSVESLGNAALLNKKENASLSNNSPHFKYVKHQGSSDYSNAWWPSHRKDLEQCAGDWTVSVIRHRAAKIANDALNFLISNENAFEID